MLSRLAASTLWYLGTCDDDAGDDDEDTENEDAKDDPVDIDDDRGIST